LDGYLPVKFIIVMRKHWTEEELEDFNDKYYPEAKLIYGD
jgi:hypothetical protein